MGFPGLLWVSWCTSAGRLQGLGVAWGCAVGRIGLLPHGTSSWLTSTFCPKDLVLTQCHHPPGVSFCADSFTQTLRPCGPRSPGPSGKEPHSCQVAVRGRRDPLAEALARFSAGGLFRGSAGHLVQGTYCWQRSFLFP